ncbi:Tim10/DDP family zinc finger-domain-containing protein [Polychytrium aggregatum]|uniref:Tim10/DDP family zinc finger-domain-containing protein n=1 Tax=Polychytrium aggregatum TaxID=110093 RepID=UPI0022FF3B67|nr:Tim10/DDP family zinc finger-domain-containing protein [Polychytrium aggregatum]KAI9209909.1 Tim10/DDP family zinc finger-domain-containing protein [Polychytrium aggregatum]
MSFFGANQNSVNPQRLAVAEQELEMVTTLFDNIINACHSKCIAKTYIEETLNKGESVCVDRCVAKYFEVNKIVGEKLTSIAQGGGAANVGGF